MSDEIIKLRKKISNLEEKLKIYEQLLIKHHIQFEDALVSSKNQAELSTGEKLSIYKDYLDRLQ